MGYHKRRRSTIVPQPNARKVRGGGGHLHERRQGAKQNMWWRGDGASVGNVIGGWRRFGVVVVVPKGMEVEGRGCGGE